MIFYIGDISKADAEVLANMTTFSTNILEFGCGASTQVIAAHLSRIAKFTSIDTSREWIEKTKDNMKLLEITTEVEFHSYDAFWELPKTEKYDFIFNDGVDALRRDFAIKAWPLLQVGGHMAFHDTRRAPDFRNVLEILAMFQDEIDSVDFNECNSNITLVRKKNPQRYENWQITENKLPWMLGYSEPDLEYIKKFKDEQHKSILEK